MTTSFVIDFNSIEGPVYTGRDRGEQLRKKLALDQLDKQRSPVRVIIPSTTYSISSSFFLGLFGPSVVAYGSADAFYGSYKFEASEFISGIVHEYVLRALQHRNLFPASKG
jgi:hypothetical protein